jgi:hypothetical protein
MTKVVMNPENWLLVVGEPLRYRGSADLFAQRLPLGEASGEPEGLERS